MLVVEVSITGPVPNTFEYFMNGFWYGISALLVFTVNEMQAVLVHWSNPRGHSPLFKSCKSRSQTE